MRKHLSFIILAFTCFAAYGLLGAMFGEFSAPMAASFGLSLDEIERVKAAFMASQVMGFLLTPLWVRRFTPNRVLTAALSTAILASASQTLVALSWLNLAASWIVLGIALSALLVAVNLLMLDRVNGVKLPVFIGASLLFTTLLPMGAYPWLFAWANEWVSWHAMLALSAWLLLSGLVVLLAYPPAIRAKVNSPNKTLSSAVPKASVMSYVFLSAALSVSVYTLLRGSYYNWFESNTFTLCAVAASVLWLVAFISYRHDQSKGKTASSMLHSSLKTNVFMYNGFLAGFAVMASNALMVNFIGKVMSYNSLNAGWVQLPSLATMLLGMLVSVIVFVNKRPLSDVFVPVGVLLILISVYIFSSYPSNVSGADLFFPLLLRGFGIGLLNVSVTLAVWHYFSATQRLEGISNFFLFRTLGGVIGSAVFSRIIQIQTADATSSVGMGVKYGSDSLAHFQQMLAQSLLTQGHLSSSAIMVKQTAGEVSQQSLSMALNNAHIAFIVAILILTPILIIGKKLVARQQG
ncbi:MAG: hypothetical protein LPH21_01445 [Shewanella sp.]|nr:hypothetical protein [Shewanella sp.]MCF1456272.1 hypothetical protein [Shewanella sp.]